MDLERLIAALAPTDVVQRAPAEVHDLAYDTRSVVPGSVFFCYAGAHVDRHDLAAEAVAKGAVALVVERPVPVAVPQVVVPDARAAMAVAADELYGRPTEALEVAGVTGTAGKTTTAFLLHAILETAGRRPGLLSTVENRIGDERVPAVRTTAEAIDLQRSFRAMLDAGNRSCVMEATSHGSALRRLDRVRFAIVVFTNLSQDHLDLHGTMESYFEAKRRLFAPGVPAVVNVDDVWGRRLNAELSETVTFGFGGGADVGPSALDGIGLKLPGRHNVANALAAFAAARVLGVERDAIVRGLERVDAVPGRMERVDAGQPFSVLVDYAHKPDALEQVLKAARSLAQGRVICVFGCGGDRDREKRPVMGRIAAELADIAIVTSDNPRSEDPDAIIAEIVAGAAGLEVEPDRSSAIELAVARARPGDVVVIAGKGHEQGQEIGGRKLPFDDREVAREALRSVAKA